MEHCRARDWLPLLARAGHRRWQAVAITVAVAALISDSAHAHPVGYHKRLLLTVSRQRVDAVLVMDIDGSDNAQLFRAQADADQDGRLSKAETGALKKKLSQLALHDLKLSVSTYPLSLRELDSKVSLREDFGVTKTGLSVALMLEAKTPLPMTDGLSLEIQDSAPDKSPVTIEVSGQMADGGAQDLGRTELPAGGKWRVRLGSLGR